MKVAAIAEAVRTAKPFKPGDHVLPEQSTLDYVAADSLPDEPESENQLVEGVIGRIAMSILFGDSNSGKTFLAVDLGAAIARSISWMGRQTVGGLVVYLATEAPQSIITRLQAYQRHHGCRMPNFIVVRSPINLFDGTADAAAVVHLVQLLEKKHGIKCELVIGDTLSRMASGANENSGEDMGTVIKHAEYIIREAGVHLMVIHHSGKDAARGARGWSGLRAAVDTELEVTGDESGARAMEITKQRDMAGKGDRIGFRLDTVNMGIGQWGKLRTSCVVAAADAPDKQTRGKRPSEIAGAIVEFLKVRGSGALKGKIAEHLQDRYTKSCTYRELKKMVESGRLIESVGIVALNQAFTLEKA